VKQLIISRDGFDTRVALLEDGRAAELYVERPGCLSRVGNIYKGRVENVLAGMDAAFVDIGIGRNGFLYVDEIMGNGVKGRSGRKITSLLRKGSEVLVQVTRDAMGGKGPRLTTQLTIAGRYIVYLPKTATTGASRRLEDGERERLRAVCRGLDLGTDGVIARTAAEGADEQAINRDLRFLRRVWASVEQRAAAWSAPALVYAEADLALRAVRDLLGPEFGDVLVDDPELHRKLVKFVRLMDPDLAGRVRLRQGGTPLFEEHGLEAEFKKAMKRRVELPSGGYIVIDHTEAMTVIDVNTGSYVGHRFLEDTTFKTNMEACREVVRQLRLRDIGGIIVIDFIDMTVPANREAVLAALQAELAKDRTKSYVVEISPLGLVEMTRQNVTPGLREVLTGPCPECRGDGRVVSEDSALAEVARRIRRLATVSTLPVVRVEVHPRIAARLSEAPPVARAAASGTATAGPAVAADAVPGSPTLLGALEVATGRGVVLETAAGDVSLDHVAVVPD
jgi:ribonuclease G